MTSTRSNLIYLTGENNLSCAPTYKCFPKRVFLSKNRISSAPVSKTQSFASEINSCLSREALWRLNQTFPFQSTLYERNADVVKWMADVAQAINR